MIINRRGYPQIFCDRCDIEITDEKRIMVITTAEPGFDPDAGVYCPECYTTILNVMIIN